ncbi:hypothetical protein BP6252_07449 [Coleophoma cylindrospora]|uniref:Heterokaryon incompatibility domain-containing protein n=1 Tax=Coleophoma cylindrospora TaxID=1849047 RepID=A0A3D8RHL4_9HELO|nr:hypothetical protein BP6252_07449 [Coleophoma cylindrospora]
MSQVYGNSSLNIAATCAKDGSMGLFFDRDPSNMKNEYIITPEKKIFEFAATGFYERCIADAPLSSRAWTFQERYLAPRTMHFSGEQIFWECCEIMASETLPDGIPNPMIRNQDQFPSTANPAEWGQMVSIYSRAKLTHPTDKLVAMSGIARKFQDQAPDLYLAGLWRGNLERQLCWRTAKLNTDSENHSTLYRAPTWSWASTDQPVTWRLWHTNDVSLHQQGQEVLIEFMNFNVVLAGSDNLGQLESAELQLKCGPLIRAKTLVDGRWYSKNTQGKVFYDLDDYSADASGFYALPTVEHIQEERTVLYGLIVKMAEKRRTGYFARVGVFDLAFDNNYRDLIRSVSTYSGGLTDELLYQEILEPNSDGIKQYSITLI